MVCCLGNCLLGVFVAGLFDVRCLARIWLYFANLLVFVIVVVCACWWCLSGVGLGCLVLWCFVLLTCYCGFSYMLLVAFYLVFVYGLLRLLYLLVVDFPLGFNFALWVALGLFGFGCFAWCLLCLFVLYFRCLFDLLWLLDLRCDVGWFIC